jgi:hypothetical protein
MPLTHIAKSITAEDIARAGKLEPAHCSVFDRPLSYLFYGRPAYRVSGDGAIKLASACPTCFIFDPALIDQAVSIYAFDTGAFDARLYKHALLEEMNIEDFSLERDTARINKLVSAVFGSPQSYFDGVIDEDSIDAKSDKWEFLAQSYLSLLVSKGRNEPDDRIGSIEATFAKAMVLKSHLKAIIVPHVIWDDGAGAPWLTELATHGVDVVPYHFVPSRHPDYYNALVEAEARRYYREKNWL